MFISSQLETFKNEFKCDWFSVSAKSNENLVDAYKQFLMNIVKKSLKEITYNNNEDEGFEIEYNDVKYYK